MKEAVAEFREAPREDALARKEQRVCHFPERQAQSEGGSRENGRPAEGAGERRGEFSVADGLRRDGVDGAASFLILQDKADDGYGLGECEPGHPLLTRADASAQSEAKRQEHAGERSAVAREDHTEAKLDGAHTERFGTKRFGFPFFGEAGEEIAAGRAVFRKFFVAAIAVIPDRGGRDESSRARLEARHCGDEIARGGHAARAKAGLALRGPAAG